MAGISVADIHKSFRQTQVLDGVSLDIEDGEFLTLVGPSGCGKTTLLRIVAGLERQDAGSICIGARIVDRVAPKDRDLAMVFQSYALYPYMTVAENVALPLEMRRLGAFERLPFLGHFVPGSGAKRRAIADEVAQVTAGLAIDHLLARRPAQLSGGQRQRVALARAMVRRPHAFLMDEPLSNLDAKMRVQARAEISELHHRLGATFVYVTHDQAEAMTMSDRVAVMMGGRLLQVASPQTIYDDPATLEVARFIGTPEINVLPARVRAEGNLEVMGQVWPITVAAPDERPVQVAVRPEAWRIEPRETAGWHPSIFGHVRHVELLGSETLVHVRLDHLSAPVIVRVDPVAGAALGRGRPVRIGVAPERVLVFDADGRRLDGKTGQPRLAEVAHG